MADTTNNRSKGGVARAESLSPEKRSEIAKKAAHARWESDLPVADYEGDVEIGDKHIGAYVLTNGKRLLSQGAFLQAIGRSRTPKAGTGVLSNVDGLPFFLQAEQLKPFISDKLRESTTPIFFRTTSGGKRVGYDAELLPMVCEVYLQLRDDLLKDKGNIPATYKHIILACDSLMRGLAHVGIIALVDEATGYQEVRDRKALQKILDKYLTDDWAKWTKTFPDNYYKHMFRLKGVKYPAGQGGKKPSYVGHWTNEVVYSRLAPGVLKTLKEKNPREVGSSSRKRKHHQYMTRDYGHPALTEHLSNITFLMAGCTTWDDFKRRLDQARPKYGDTIEMDLD